MLTEESMSDVGQAISDALAVLRELAKSDKQSGEVRVQAAKAILDFSTEMMSFAESMEDEEFEDEDFEEE